MPRKRAGSDSSRRPERIDFQLGRYGFVGVSSSYPDDPGYDPRTVDCDCCRIEAETEYPHGRLPGYDDPTTVRDVPEPDTSKYPREPESPRRRNSSFGPASGSPGRSTRHPASRTVRKRMNRSSSRIVNYTHQEPIRHKELKGEKRLEKHEPGRETRLTEYR